ncbi:MAG: hypothetical protein FGM46_05140 [Ferruginibacter sp.]|nr:hypothetical protein [Ferruginibacter sp.]
MKKLFPYLLLFCISSIYSCKKCKNEDPQARIINKGTEKASVQIKTSGGNTVNINNVDPGTASVYSAFSQGQVTFTITVDNINVEKTINLNQCYYYDISIDANNIISYTSINRNE